MANLRDRTGEPRGIDEIGNISMEQDRADELQAMRDLELLAKIRCHREFLVGIFSVAIAHHKALSQGQATHVLGVACVGSAEERHLHQRLTEVYALLVELLKLGGG